MLASGGSTRQELVDAIRTAMERSSSLRRGDALRWADLADVFSAITELLQDNPLSGLEHVMTFGLRAFIVHGHDEQLLLETKDYIQNVLGWPEPIVLKTCSEPRSDNH